MKVKTSFLLLSAMFLMTTTALNGNPQKPRQQQHPKSAIVSTTGFTLSWKQVDSLANLGQPRSALAIADKIYAQARAEKNDPQMIKAIIYRIRLNSEFRENFLTSTIGDLQKEVDAAVPPAKQVLQSILAEVYWKYYQSNQYRFLNRTKVKSEMADSLETWDLSTIYRAITRNYLLSLENTDTLRRIPIGKFDAILKTEVFNVVKSDTTRADAARFVPTLYDFLAGRALDFFSSGVSGKSLPAVHFEVDQPMFFSQPFNFSGNRMMIPADTAAPASFAMRLFRDLASFHLNDKDPRALIETELKRFAFVHEKYTLQNKDSLYIDALRQFEKSQLNSAWSASISYALASFLNSQGALYQPLISDLHKWETKSALEICDRAVKQFPGSEGSKNCQILAKMIKESSLQVTAESAVLPEKPSLALIGVKNIKQLYFRLVKINPETYAEKAGTLDPPAYLEYLTSMAAAKAWSQNLPDDGDYQKHQTEIPVPAVPFGFWVLLCAPDKDFKGSKVVFAAAPFWSTQISYVSKRNDDGSYTYFLPDRETGTPLKNISAEVWEKNYDYNDRKYTNTKLQTLTSDAQGYVGLPPSDNSRHHGSQYLKIYYKDDFLITDNFYQYPAYNAPEQTMLQTLFYTDRAIYRPGQVVYFKGIIVERKGENSKIKTDHKTKVVFTDVNGQRVSEQPFTTNKFGSFNGSFVAPTGVLTGQMTISNESGSTAISVEEYKRPTFEVSCDPVEGNYKLGAVITVTGKALAYAGNPVDAGLVNYRVVRTARFPFWDWGWRCPVPVSPQVEIVNGTATTDPAGRFNLTFKAVPDLGFDQKTWPVFDFTIYADVTDISGETQTTQTSVSVGYKALLIETDIPEMVNLSKDTIIKITTTNTNGRHTPALVSIRLQSLRAPDRTFIPRMWERPDKQILTMEDFHARFPNNQYDDENNPATWATGETVFEKAISTGSDSTLNLLDPASRIQHPGSYLLILKTTDPFGESVELKKYLTVFSPASRDVPGNSLSWFVPLKTSGEPGETARFLVGSAEDKVSMFYEVRLHDSLVSREQIKINKRAMLIEVPIKEQYRGNFGINFLFVKHNRVFQYSQLITVPHTGKKLGIAFETFRDKLDPGAKESWKIKISGEKGNPADAEFMAAMYDASLDIFRSNEWNFNMYQRVFGLISWDTDNAFRASSGQWFPPNEMSDNLLFHPGIKLNWFGNDFFSVSDHYPRYSRGGVNKNMQAEMMDSQVALGARPAEMAPTTGMKKEGAADTITIRGNVKPALKTQTGQTDRIRRDFRETAFFYPTLETDSSGSLVLQFTAPESLTRWKFLGLAHSKDLDYGLVEKELTTRKELMVFPNAPRFVRQGDTVVFSARIVNLSDHDLIGIVTISLTDAFTLQPLNNMIDSTQDKEYGMRDRVLNMKKGQSNVVSWRLFIPDAADLAALQYRITASSGNFSDGEEKAIPVLTNRMLITESMALPAKGKGTTDFSFEKLLKSVSPGGKSATLRNHKLVLEFASNPAWYAIQALPSLNDQPHENADAIFSAYWSNSVAGYIANSNPSIREVFESWKNLTPDALLSNLAKNQELKSAMLQETPWVMEAAGESDRKQRLGLYFDQDNLALNLQQNLKKLQQLQSPNGGWTWFAGMPENRYTTQNILTGLGKLHHLGITKIMTDPASRGMVTKAIRFLDGELQKDYENLKKYQSGNLDGNHLGNLQIQYLYARSFFMNDPASRIPDPGSAFAEVFGFYTKQAAKYWQQNDRHLQGMIAIALNRIGGTDVPALILKSLSEKALHSNEMGMYWAGERGYFWHQAPVETQALMIEAYDEIAKDENTVEDLKVWLLKQKQTQDWRTPHATLEACYALLLRGTDLLSEDPGVKITVGKENINSAKLMDVKKEAGTGYFQVSWSGNEIKPEMGSISVSKSTESVAWGAVYWQYFENLDKITTASTPLHLEKKLFVEKNSETGPVLEQITNDKLQMTKDTTKSDSHVYLFTGVLKTGEKIVVRIILKVDRDLEFVHMKDMRASALEPYFSAVSDIPHHGSRVPEPASGYRYQDGLGYYQSTTDQATNFFFDYLPKGTYVFEYALKVNAEGEYANGVTTVQCMYAPEFAAHSEGIRIDVK